jgi:hypothetical protein
MAGIIPKAVLDYIKNKKLKVGFSYKDVWNEEHAAAFTVAKAMQIDILSDLHNAAIQAAEKGQSFDTFKKNLKPTFQQKGWWGRKEMTDPLTGKTVDAQLGSDRRLKTIYNVNMRSAYQKGQYDRTMESDLHPYLMYRIGPSVKHRQEYASWDGLVLPKNDLFWDSHFPHNGWGCKCYTRAVTESQRKKYEAEGIPVPPRADGSGGGTLKIKTEAPPVTYRSFFNERTGTLERIPNGISPGFNWNQGNTSRSTAALEQLVQKTRDKVPPEQFEGIINPVLKSQANKNDFYGFIEDALEKKQDRQHSATVGVLDSKITRFLSVIRNRLVKTQLLCWNPNWLTAKKFKVKHTLLENAPSKED